MIPRLSIQVIHTFSMPSSNPSSFPGISWDTPESKPELEPTSGGDEGFAADEETEAPELLLHTNSWNLRPLYLNTETLLPYELKIEFWQWTNAGDVVEKGILANAWDNFMVRIQSFEVVGSKNVEDVLCVYVTEKYQCQTQKDGNFTWNFLCLIWCH